MTVKRSGSPSPARGWTIVEWHAFVTYATSDSFDYLMDCVLDRFDTDLPEA